MSVETIKILLQICSVLLFISSILGLISWENGKSGGGGSAHSKISEGEKRIAKAQEKGRRRRIEDTQQYIKDHWDNPNL